jgi:VWFA-related protein
MRGTLVLIAALYAAMQMPVFRTRTDLVRIDALVEDDGRPVTSLTARDFIVRDNGVVQELRAAHAVEAVDLGIVLDVSGSMSRDRLERSAAALEALEAGLAPTDRYHAFAFANQVRSIGASLTGAQMADGLRKVIVGGQTALVDAAYAAIIKTDTAPGPKLLLVMTDGRNNSSWLRGQDLVDTARRHETVIYPVAVGVASNVADMSRLKLLSIVGGDTIAFLRILATETGGRVITAEWTAKLGDVFRAILKEYRQRYLLTFTPEGVGTDDGWHTLEVKLNGGLKGRVHARRGYLAAP